MNRITFWQYSRFQKIRQNRNVKRLKRENKRANANAVNASYLVFSRYITRHIYLPYDVSKHCFS